MNVIDLTPCSFKEEAQSPNFYISSIKDIIIQTIIPIFIFSITGKQAVLRGK